MPNVNGPLYTYSSSNVVCGTESIFHIIMWLASITCFYHIAYLINQVVKLEIKII